MKFDTVNIQQLAVILICGVGLTISILKGSNDLAMAIGSGLVGYLGGVGTSSKSETAMSQETGGKE